MNHVELCVKASLFGLETQAPPVKQTASFRIKNAKCYLHPKHKGRAEDNGRQIGPGQRS